MLKIAIVDDKSTNRNQVKNSLPGNEFDFFEYDSFDSFFLAYPEGAILPDVLVLDYFLEQGKTGADLLKRLYRIFPEAKSKVKIIGFSSILACSEKLAAISGGYGLEKDKAATSNPQLTEVVYKYLSHTK